MESAVADTTYGDATGSKSTSTASPAKRIADVGVSRMPLTAIASAPSDHSWVTTLRTSRSVRIWAAAGGVRSAAPGTAVGSEAEAGSLRVTRNPGPVTATNP